MTDKKIARISAASVLAALLVVLFLPIGDSGRIAAAVILLPSAILIPAYVKKRDVLSINKNQILLIMTVTALLCVMAYYLTGIEFGFFKNPYRLTLTNFALFTAPITVVIVCTEIIRCVFAAQKDKVTEWLSYAAYMVSEMLIVSNIPSVTSFNRFMELVAGTLFPAVLSTLLYNYIATRYGMYPNLWFRLITTLHAFILPVVPGIEDSIVSFFKLILPIAIYLFVDALFEKKLKYALKNKSRFLRATKIFLAVTILALMILTVMLISNQFDYGALVIATESMTGEINKGDVVIFESYNDQAVEEGQIIIFERNRSMIVHRVVDIEIINGATRYFTKGDANEDNDLGYITDADIVGLATLKIPMLGYPTIWVRSLFEH